MKGFLTQGLFCDIVKGEKCSLKIQFTFKERKRHVEHAQQGTA
jgi:hypothetical protein